MIGVCLKNISKPVGSSRIVKKFLVSKETVLLHRWESETGNFGFIKLVDKGRITTMNDLES